MTNTYKLSVNDEFEFQLDAQDVNSLDTSLQPNNKQHILEDSASQSVHIEGKDVLNRQYTVRINGNRYQVAIKNDLDLLIEEMGLMKVAGTQIFSLAAIPRRMHRISSELRS